MYTITPNSHRAQAESETLLSSMELSVQLLAAIQKENLTIYQYRPSVSFEKKEDNGNEVVKVSYAYKFHTVSPGVYPVFASIRTYNVNGISDAIEDIVGQIAEYSKNIQG